MAAPAVSQIPVPIVKRRSAFYASTAAFFALVIFLGFARTYYLKAFFHTRELSPLVHVHGALMTCWMLVLIAQTSLVAKRRTDLHRKVGLAAGVLLLAIIPVSTLVAIRAVQLGHAPTGVPPTAFLIVPLGDIVIFTALMAAAFWYRKRPEIHKRLIIVASIAILPPGIARWPWSWVAHHAARFFAVADLILIAIIAYDYWRMRRLSPAYLWGGLLLLLSHPLRLMFSHTATWTAIAQWITGVH